MIGNNPNTDSRSKDFWDHRDGTGEEQDIMENLRDYISNQPYNVETTTVFNSFDNSVNHQLEKI